MAEPQLCCDLAARRSAWSLPCACVGRWTPRINRRLLLTLLLLLLVMPAVAYGGKKKKNKFLAAYPIIFKFFLFWWCIFVFAVMTVYILDMLLTKKFGPARVDWTVEHTFRGVKDRESYWSQLVDPTTWSTTHPVLQTADVRMVKCDAQADSSSGAVAAPTSEDDDSAAPDTNLTPVPLGVLEPGLGLILRHKENSGPRAGTFFCTRACTQLEQPKEGAWRFVMRTVEVGAGYPFSADTEEIELQMWPPADDGSIRCEMSGMAAVQSRVFRWWTGLFPASKQGATALLEAIGSEVESGKKKD